MHILSTFRFLLPVQKAAAITSSALVLCASLMFASQAAAHGFTAGDLEIGHPHVLAPAASAKSAAGYLTIANQGQDADRLIGVEIPSVKHSELHTTTHGADGVARMGHVDAIEIPSGETVALERGGMHIMLMGLTDPLTEGQMIPATLIFERAGRVEVEFSVDPASKADDHSHMNH